MGFSVSGATAIVLIGGLIAFGTAFATGANGFERVSQAQDDRAERLLDQQNTEIEIVDAVYEGNDDSLTVEVDNEGATELSVESTTLLVDGEFVDAGETETEVVDAGGTEGDADTDVWATGRTLTFAVEGVDAPDSAVKVVTETGVAAVETDVRTEDSG